MIRVASESVALALAIEHGESFGHSVFPHATKPNLTWIVGTPEQLAAAGVAEVRTPPKPTITSANAGETFRDAREAIELAQRIERACDTIRKIAGSKAYVSSARMLASAQTDANDAIRKLRALVLTMPDPYPEDAPDDAENPSGIVCPICNGRLGPRCGCSQHGCRSCGTGRGLCSKHGRESDLELAQTNELEQSDEP